MSTPLVDRGLLPESTTSRPRIVRLTAHGTALIVVIPAEGLPAVLHWGADIGTVSAEQLAELEKASLPPFAVNGVDEYHAVALLPEAWTGWMGTPGVIGHRNGAAWSPRFRVVEANVIESAGSGGEISVVAQDAVAGLTLALGIELLESAVVRLHAELHNTGAGDYYVEGVQLGLPVPQTADEIHDLAGRWAKERVPQVRPFTVGSHVREGRHGRTGADAATVLIAAERGLDFERGRAWGIHVGFSGNHRVIAERVSNGQRMLLGGELLLPGEVILAPGESYRTPPLYGVWGDGLDALARRFHEHLRARPRHPVSPRPVVMNVWEAVYFDHDLDKLLTLAQLAAEVGVERFVLDDGWFGGRRDDNAGLGDWVVSEEVWGGGRFRTLVDRVKELGMEFGLWFEPEMVNVDSDLARAHPEWLLQVDGRLPIEARNQQVLDLTHPGAYAHVRDQILAMVREYDIEFIKWDHNRDLVDAGSTRTGRAGVHEQTLATYRLLDEIRSACPGLEIESCSSGGARVDLGILERTDRVWASDCIDAHERQEIQRWTAQLVPPELVGSHIGEMQAHTTGRRLELGFRAATAIFGHLGIEWDLTRASEADLRELTRWVSFYKQVRRLIHNGVTVRRSFAGGDLWLHGAVAGDCTEALYSLALRERPISWPAGRVTLPGLDPERIYLVRPAGPGVSEAAFDAQVHPAWWDGGVLLTGAVLSTIGVEAPALDPDHAVVIHVVAVDGETS